MPIFLPIVQIGAKISKTASNIQRKLIEIVTSESTTTTAHYVGSEADNTEYDEESFTSIIWQIDEETTVTPKQAPVSNNNTKNF